MPDEEGYVAYLQRIVDIRLSEILSVMGGVLLEGARACGKTSTGVNRAGSVLRLDESPLLAEQVQDFPRAFLEGEVPRLIDEWQLAPNIWNAARHEIDTRRAPGQFIFSGSAAPSYEVTRHSGAGRISRLRMRTMSLSETGDSTKQVSLAGLFDGREEVACATTHTLEDIAWWICRGGWPGLLGVGTGEQRKASTYVDSYIDNVVSVDIAEASGVSHNPLQIRRLMMSLSRYISAEATLKTLASDIGTGEPIHYETVRAYLNALAQIFVYEPLPPWSGKLRSRSRLRRQPKIHFVDPSLAAGSLGVSPERLLTDFETLGLLFESLVVRDLRIYAEAMGARVSHYRDNTGLEVDVMIEGRGANWAACEVKLGSGRIEDAERALLELANERIDTDVFGQPKFLAVITGTQYGYRLKSGVYVIPLAALAA